MAPRRVYLMSLVTVSTGVMTAIVLGVAGSTILMGLALLLVVFLISLTAGYVQGRWR